MDPNNPNVYVDVDTYTTRNESVDSLSNIPIPTVGSSSRSKTSSVWEHFEKISIPNPDGSITFRAKCKYCAHLLSAASASGTSHLKRHANKHLQTQQPDIRNQMQLGASSTGNLQTFSYDPIRAQNAVVDYIIKQEQPFTTSECPDFTEMIHQSFSPQYQSFSRNTTRNRILKRFEDIKTELFDMFRNLNGRVCLTSDLWSNNCFEYQCITAHFIDSDWKLNKRIISFKLVELPYTGHLLGVQIRNVLYDWALQNKIFTISLDNATYYNQTVAHLKSTLQLLLDGDLFHVRCCAHILNLIVKEAMHVYETSVLVIRNAIVTIMSSGNRISEYKKICQLENMPFRKLILDVDSRWNSTFNMLKTACKQRRAIDLFYATTSTEGILTPTELNWLEVALYKDFLKVFDTSTKLFSYIYIPTSPFVLHMLAEIIKVFVKYMGNEYYVTIITSMKAKFDKYFDPLPHMLGLAIIIDPRCKEIGLQEFLDRIFDDQTQFAPIMQTCNRLFEEYRASASVNIPTHTTQAASSRGGRLSVFSAIKSRRISQHTSVSSSELQRYLESPSVDDSDDFDILEWWKQNETMWPVISQMARDILTVPISTVASETAFSAGGRVLSDYRSRLSPQMVEALMISRDHMHAITRNQNYSEKERIQNDLDDISSGNATELSDSSDD